MKRFLVIAASAALAMVGSSAIAASITVTDITGTWGNATGAAVTGDGTDTISWGSPATSDGASSYNFEAANVPIVDPGSPFVIGDFTHNNFPVFPPSITGADLTVTVEGDIDGQAFSLGGVFQFSHFETPNGANPCAAGGTNPCPDLVTYLGATGLFGDTIVVDDTEFVLSLTGFADGLTFLTAEGESNSAQLFAEFTADPFLAPIPLPAAGWMLLLGVGGLAAARRKRMKS